MKKIYTIFLTVMIMATGSLAMAAVNPRVKGSVKDEKGDAIPYCNVMYALQGDSLNMRGDVSNEAGLFDIPVPAGKYYFTVVLLGYEPFRQAIDVTGDVNLGTVVLKESAINIDAAVVRAEMIHRKADGYLFSPSNSPIVNGRNSLELLNYAPGVWYDSQKGITINGKSGTKVMINDRVLKMSGDELTNYLENINAEDIKSIEVIPDVGVQYDADATGGILKITLKRSTVAGMTGSVTLGYDFSQYANPTRLRPGVNLDFRKNRLSLYMGVSYNDNRFREKDRETTSYETTDRRIENNLDMTGKYTSYAGRFGAVYELTDRQSVGIDADMAFAKSKQDAPMYGTITEGDKVWDVLSRYRSKTPIDRYAISFNYKLKTDTLGSTLMVTADYMNRASDTWDNNYLTETLQDGMASMSNRNSGTDSRSDYYTVRVDYKHYLNAKVQLETGMKYNYTDMETDLQYEDEEDGAWVPNTELSDHYLYREGVLAGYVNAMATVGRFNLSAGLRVENTDLSPVSYTYPGKTKKQNYTDYFPSAIVNFILNKEKGHSVSANYSRRINRPGFNQLNPFRVRMNSFTYLVGNPDIKASYTDNFTLTGVLSNMYSLTVGIQNQKGAVNQMVIPDPEDPEVMLYQHRNMDRVTMYIASLSAPVNLFKWWRLGLEATYFYSENRMETISNDKGTFRGRINNLFTLPKGWSTEFNYSYQSAIVSANMEIGEAHSFYIGVKKNLMKNKLAVSAYVQNLFEMDRSIIMNNPGSFYKEIHQKGSNVCRVFGISLRYNFRAGKDVKVNKVTVGNEEERSR